MAMPPTDPAPKPLPKDVMRPVVKRFFTRVDVGPAEGGRHHVTLDGRPAKTPGRAILALPTRTLAEAVAAEWAAQGTEIHPLTMPITRLVNSAIDGVGPRMEQVRADIVAYAGTDLICYRAETPSGLVGMQSQRWDPVVAWARADLGTAPRLAAGVVHVDQPAEFLAAVAHRLATLDPFRLASLHVMTTLTGSVLLALGTLARAWTVDEAWHAAHVDEDWQISQWGEDIEAAQRRRQRWTDMQAAWRAVELLDGA